MTAEDNETFAEHAAQAHLQARHPATTGAYATHVPRHAILLDLREVGICRCPLTDQARGITGEKPGVALATADPAPPKGSDRPAPVGVADHGWRGSVR